MTSVCTEINCLNTTKISVTQQNVVDIFKSNNSRLNFTTNRQSVTVNAKLGNNKIKTAPKIFVFLSGLQLHQSPLPRANTWTSLSSMSVCCKFSVSFYQSITGLSYVEVMRCLNSLVFESHFEKCFWISIFIHSYSLLVIWFQSTELLKYRDIPIN